MSNADMDHGVIRSVPLVTLIGSEVVPSLTLEMLRLASGNQSFTVKSGVHGVEKVGFDGLSIPTQSDGALWVHYGHHDRDRFISARKILDGSADPGALDHKLVIVGLSGLGLVDFPSTAIGERVPGVEIHAQLLESIFDGTTLLRPHWAIWAEGVVMLVLGWSIIHGFRRVRAPVLVPGALLIALVLVIVGGLLYYYQHLLLDFGSPIFLTVTLFGGMLADSLITEQRQRKILEENLRVQREQAARVQGEMEAAQRFQMGLVPDAEAIFAQEARLDITARMEPARMVGGDLYDCFMLDENRAFFMVGDVCGKGIPASLFMVVSKTLCKSVALRHDIHYMNLSQLIRQANIEISRDNPEMLFVTAFLGLLDLRTGELAYCNAGHEKPLLISAGTPPRELDGVGGPPISIMDDFAYTTQQYKMAPGEFLCVFSDGITEAFNPAQEEYGKARLEAAMHEISPASTARDILEIGCKDVRTYSEGAEPSDDLTMMVLRWNKI